jgi:hypothetical protein
LKDTLSNPVLWLFCQSILATTIPQKGKQFERHAFKPGFVAFLPKHIGKIIPAGLATTIPQKGKI